MFVTVLSLTVLAVTFPALAVRHPSVAVSAVTTAAGTTPRSWMRALAPRRLMILCNELAPTHLLMGSPMERPLMGSLPVPMGNPLNSILDSSFRHLATFGQSDCI